MKADFVLAVALILAMPVVAQADEQNTDPHQPQQQKCRIQPGHGDQRKQPDAENLTEKLEPCAGVLEPPPTGDRNTTAPPADSGNMPIIKPGETPPQPKGQQN